MAAAAMRVQNRLYREVFLETRVGDLNVFALPFLEDFDFGWLSAHWHGPIVGFFVSVVGFNVLRVNSPTDSRNPLLVYGEFS